MLQILLIFNNPKILKIDMIKWFCEFIYKEITFRFSKSKSVKMAILRQLGQTKHGSAVYIGLILCVLHDLPLCVISAAHRAALISHTECMLSLCQRWSNFSVNVIISMCILQAILGQLRRPSLLRTL